VDVWHLLAVTFFGAMGMFAGAAALYLTRRPPSTVLLGHTAGKIVLFCLFAIALSAVIATLGQTTLGQTMWAWMSR
jgi:hypothetical protein